MPKIALDARFCKGCRLCVVFCPKGALAMSTEISRKGVNAAVVADESACTGCLNCAVMCPEACIEISPSQAKAQPAGGAGKSAPRKSRGN